MEKLIQILAIGKLKKKVDHCTSDCDRFTAVKKNFTNYFAFQDISIQLNIGMPVKNFRLGQGFLKLFSKKKVDANTGYRRKQLHYTWKIGQLTARHFMENNAGELPYLTQNEKDTLEGLLAYFIAQVGVFYHSKNSWVILPRFHQLKFINSLCQQKT